MTKNFLVNCHIEHWGICKEKTIFGLKENTKLPNLEKGDLIFLRIKPSKYGKEKKYGLKAI